MPPKVALTLCIGFTFWLFYRRKQEDQDVSRALWVPLIWLLILASKPLSLWLNMQNATETADSYVEGSPFDRLVFLLLIVAGLIILAKRGVSWSEIFANNKWLCGFVFFCGISVLWSDYPFVSFKRWFKDSGNIVMALVVLSETKPIDAIKSLFSKSIYLLVPFSILVVKYFPEIGRYYDRWTYLPSISGVSTGKNSLGMVLFVSGVALIWMLLMLRSQSRHKPSRSDFIILLLLSTMNFWLLYECESSTALACTLISAGILWSTKFSWVRRKANNLIGYTFAILAAFLILNATFNVGELLVRSLGRDITLTGRTDIWHLVLKENVNPLIGTGFYSFWLGDRARRVSEQYSFPLNEAHNGYLETYLNSGLIGLFLLLGFLISSAKRIGRNILTDFEYAPLRLAFLISTMMYAVSESVFNRLNLAWLVLLLVAIEYPRKRAAVPLASSKDENSFLPTPIASGF